MTIINVHTDGGARGNPGPAGAGFVIDKNNKELHRGNKYLGKKTNNQAEYLALIEAVNWLKENINKEVEIINFFLDSELVVRQVKGEYRVKNQGLKPLHADVMRKLSELDRSYFFKSIPREKNKIADKLANDILDAHNEN